MADIIASADLDLEKILAKFDTLERNVSNLERSATKADKAFSKLGKGIAAAALANGIGAAAGEMFQLNRAAGQVDERFAAIHGGAFDLTNGANGLEKGIRATREGLLGITDLLPGIGGKIRQVAEATDKEAEDQLRINNAISMQSETMDEIVTKARKLEDLRATESAKVFSADISNPTQNKENVERLTEQLNILASKYNQIAGKRLDLEKDITAGLEQRLAIQKLESDTSNAKADLEKKLSNLTGKTSKELEASKKAGFALIDREAARQKAKLTLQMVEEKNQKNLNNIAAQTGFSYADQLNYVKEQISGMDVLLNNARELNLEGTLQFSVFEKQKHELEQQVKLMELARAQEIHSATLGTQIAKAELTGNKELGANLQTRLQFENEIAEAELKQNWALAEQLKAQHKMAQQANEIAFLEKSPRQREDEKRQRQRRESEVRALETRQRLNPNARFTDERARVQEANKAMNVNRFEARQVMCAP